MSRLYPVAGSKIFIGTAVSAAALVTASDFAGMVWTEIDGWTNAGSIGDTTEIITQKLINQTRVRKAKGTRDAGTMENQFVPMGDDAGQQAFIAAIEDCAPYAFRIDWSANCPRVFTATISNGTDAEVGAAGHGLANGTPVVFSTTGALPTGLTAGLTYYVVDAATDTFSVATTPGGAAIDTSSAGSGVHTVTAGEIGQTDMFYGYAMSGAKQGGDADTMQLRSWSIAIDSNILSL